ncbi:DUF1761 domain-containing protein [Henriciella barbarensis]|uniref:DUF1761 domain-containing protein n=1 Tax=Henriciella barbarensis TaxID=86342 RepID=A0A399QPX6_9PROT|nr:DUF1761 domain-containing protein [Henriciella barbarensis]RIJ20541.1 DUF1761 domain-containing protein [Henriciella barbarensis]
MPRLAGINLVGVLVSAILIYFIGFLWYGLLFSEVYMSAHGIFINDAGDAISFLTSGGVATEGQEDANPMWMLGGFLVPVILSFGFAWLMRKSGVAGLGAAVSFGLTLSLLIGVPLMAYDFFYTPWHSAGGLLVDLSHTVVTFVVGCAVLSKLD